MTTKANTIAQYLGELPQDRKGAMKKLRETILKNLPKGFAEVVANGMISYVVPHSLYAPGYHANPQQALPLMSLASQKNFIALYHMGLYSSPELLKWFEGEYSKHVKTKLDMGKSCIRFKKPDEIPFQLIGELASKMTPTRWIHVYESQLKS